MATAVLPPLLPTPPRSKMMPLLPTPCLVILPASFPPLSSRPGRADSVERWDANKKPSSPVSPSSGSSGSPGRAYSVERWDANKKPSSPVSSSSGCSGSPGRTFTCDRWDSNKIKSPRGTSSSSERRQDSSKSPSRASACERWGSSKRPLNRASSAERWDNHKKPRPPQADDFDVGKSSVGSRTTDLEIDNHAQTDEKTKSSTVALKEMVEPPAVFSGASFFASPKPGMLPMPSFLLAR